VLPGAGLTVDATPPPVPTASSEGTVVVVTSDAGFSVAAPERAWLPDAKVIAWPVAECAVTVVPDCDAGKAGKALSICGAASTSVSAVNAPKMPASTSHRLAPVRNPCIFTVENVIA
jgi:hypothetical protein